MVVRVAAVKEEDVLADEAAGMLAVLSGSSVPGRGQRGLGTPPNEIECSLSAATMNAAVRLKKSVGYIGTRCEQGTTSRINMS